MATNIKISQMPKAENAKGIDLIPVVLGGINKTVTVNQIREGLATSSDLNNKVDKINGKGLSEKDFTTALYNKLNGIATNANNYVHPSGSGNNHIPAGGNSGQYLVWSAAGTAVWGNAPSSTVSLATADALGGIKIGYTSSDKNYAVLLDDTGKAFVNVPWLNTTYTAATALTLGLVKQGVAVADASAEDVTDKLNALLLSLRNAGIIAK